MMAFLPDQWVDLDRLNHELQVIRRVIECLDVPGFHFMAEAMGGVACLRVGMDVVQEGRQRVVWSHIRRNVGKCYPRVIAFAAADMACELARSKLLSGVRFEGQYLYPNEG